MMNKRYAVLFFVVGAVMTVVGSFSQLLKLKLAPYLFSLGALCIILLQLIATFGNKEVSPRVQRLNRINLLYSLSLGWAAYCMFIDSNTWVVAVLIYALSVFFLSFRGE